MVYIGRLRLGMPMHLALLHFHRTRMTGNLPKVQKCRVQLKSIRIAMSEYRFHLQKYKYGSKISCPSCGKPRCFVKYVDAEGEIVFPGNVGKCDHENSCGYHYTPKEYFKHHSVRLQSLSSRHCSCKHGTALDSAVYFKDNPDVLARDQSVGESFQAALCKYVEEKPVLTVPSYIPLSYVDRSLSHYEINPLYRYLCNGLAKKKPYVCSVISHRYICKMGWFGCVLAD